MIEEIGIDINEVNIPDIRVYQPPGWATDANAIFAVPPVTQEVGVPVVDMPGCVEAHEQNTSKEKNKVFKCKHAVCRECYKQLKRTRPYKCPVCRKEYGRPLVDPVLVNALSFSMGGLSV